MDTLWGNTYGKCVCDPCRMRQLRRFRLRGQHKPEWQGPTWQFLHLLAQRAASPDCVCKTLTEPPWSLLGPFSSRSLVVQEEEGTAMGPGAAATGEGEEGERQ